MWKFAQSLAEFVKITLLRYLLLMGTTARFCHLTVIIHTESSNVGETITREAQTGAKAFQFQILRQSYGRSGKRKDTFYPVLIMTHLLLKDSACKCENIVCTSCTN